MEEEWGGWGWGSMVAGGGGDCKPAVNLKLVSEHIGRKGGFETECWGGEVA